MIARSVTPLLVVICLWGLGSRATEPVTAGARPVAVLVPGFFSSLVFGYVRVTPEKLKVDIQPYFAINILRAFASQGVEPVVVDTLSPVGTLEDNGRRLIAFLDRLNSDAHFKGRPLHLIAHSAGGLYSLFAIAHRPDIGIQSLTTLSTPFHGAEFVDRLATGVPGLESAVSYMNLQSLPQMRPANVARFVSQFDLPKNFVIKVFAGEQSFYWDPTDARGLSWPMNITSLLIDRRSDGIVSVDSSYATGVLTHTQGPLPILKGTNTLPLEHWEQTLDYRVFTLLGIRNAAYIRDTQDRFYGSLAKSIIGR